jgi:murein L,D-transpeptidase YcbB/YkuD
MEVIDANGNPVDPAAVDLSNPAAYRFRQRPGTENSLGLVKFMFPNTFNVYLHDTPVDSLFARATRSFSHGCVRLEQPEALARYVLADQPEWTPEKIQAAMHGAQETTVKLRQPIPVYLAYWTARVSPDGILQFRNDVYGIDGRQAQTLAERLTRLKQHAAANASASRASVLDRPGNAGVRARDSRQESGQRADGLSRAADPGRSASRPTRQR